MRIVAGSLRGRALVAPKGHSTRPTADRARQAVFNILDHASWSDGVEDARVIDLFAGSGALGLEALSRGAAFCLFVESAGAALVAIRDNAEALGVAGQTRIRTRNAAALGPMGLADGPPFDVAFLDPPYGEGLGERSLASLAEGGWLALGALAVLERGLAEPAGPSPGFETLDERSWGAARVTFLRFTASPA